MYGAQRALRAVVVVCCIFSSSPSDGALCCARINMHIYIVYIRINHVSVSLAFRAKMKGFSPWPGRVSRCASSHLSPSLPKPTVFSPSLAERRKGGLLRAPLLRCARASSKRSEVELSARVVVAVVVVRRLYRVYCNIFPVFARARVPVPRR